MEEAVEQSVASVRVYLDGAASPQGAPSTIVDASNGPLRVLRVGAISEEELRAAVPKGWVELEPPAGTDPGTDTDTDPGTAPAPEARGEDAARSGGDAEEQEQPGAASG